MTPSITMTAAWKDKGWALAGATGLLGMALGAWLGNQQAPCAQPISATQAAHLAPASSSWTTLYAAGPQTDAQPPNASSNGRADEGMNPATTATVPLTPTRPRDVAQDVEAAERHLLLNQILGRPHNAPLSEAELQRQGPTALLAVAANLQADPDTRLEAASAMQAYFDTPLPTPAALQLLDMASAQTDALQQQDALDLVQGRMRPELVPAVSAFLRSPDAATREMAIQRLSELPQDSQARAALAQAAEQDSSEVLRYLAARRR